MGRPPEEVVAKLLTTSLSGTGSGGGGSGSWPLSLLEHQVGGGMSMVAMRRVHHDDLLMGMTGDTR